VSKHPSKHLRPARPLSTGFAGSVHKQDGTWMVRAMRPEDAAKQYRCPGCDLAIPPGVAHVVVWPAEPSIGSASAVDERRHWHRACWEKRR